MIGVINDLEGWQVITFFVIFYVIGFLHGRFPGESRDEVRKNYWKKK